MQSQLVQVKSMIDKKRIESYDYKSIIRKETVEKVNTEVLKKFNQNDETSNHGKTILQGWAKSFGF